MATQWKPLTVGVRNGSLRMPAYVLRLGVKTIVTPPSPGTGAGIDVIIGHHLSRVGNQFIRG